MTSRTTSADSRQAIFSKIRNSLKQGSDGTGIATDDAARTATVKDRLARRPVQSTIARIDKSHPELVALFRDFLEGQSATVLAVDAPGDIPAVIATYLRDNNLPARLRMGDDPLLERLDWSGESSLTRLRGAATNYDKACLSRALVGAAETGTLFLASGKDNPVTLSFMPDTHIIVVKEADILGSYEMAWDALRQNFGENTLPRTINMISGPSRTGDIGGVLVRGAHGPREMCVIIVKDA